MTAIFKKYDFTLGFPCDAENGSIVTDWSYWYARTNPILQEFVKVIHSDYADRFGVQDSFVGASVKVIHLESIK